MRIWTISNNFNIMDLKKNRFYKDYKFRQLNVRYKNYAL
jgi:hypothetical protein